MSETAWIPCPKHPLRVGPFTITTAATVPACFVCERERSAAEVARLRAIVAAFAACDPIAYSAGPSGESVTCVLCSAAIDMGEAHDATCAWVLAKAIVESEATR